MNTQDIPAVPEVLHVRTKGFETALRRWMLRNRRVPLSYLLRDALAKELAPLAGKRDEIFQDFQKNFPPANGVKPAKQEKE